MISEFFALYLSIGAALYIAYLFGSKEKEVTLSHFISKVIIIELIWPVVLYLGVKDFLKSKNEKK